MNKELIKQQFGANAAAYITSRPHAKGASLARLVELVRPQADWHVLDVATAAGHTAFAFAPHVTHVWATDITPEMLTTAAQLAQQRNLNNITVEYADAEELPYADERFDLVTCRIAPHHFGNVAPFLREAERVLRPGGVLAIVDNVVPEGAAGDYVNAFEKLRDPSHGRCLTMDEWRSAFRAQTFVILHEEVLAKEMAFKPWADRHDDAMRRFLLAMLTEAGPEPTGVLKPHGTGDETAFYLYEGIIVGRKRSA